MRLFKTRAFGRHAGRAGLDDPMLADAIRRGGTRLIDADLGGGVIKQRVARPNQGRSGGFRTIVGYRSGDRAVFLSGFAKNERDNVRPDELENLREIGAAALALNDAGLTRAIDEGRCLIDFTCSYLAIRKRNYYSDFLGTGCMSSWGLSECH